MEELTHLLEAVAVLQTEQGRMKEDVAEIKQDVKRLMLKPGTRWDAAVEKALLCLISAVIAVLMTGIS